MSNDFNTKNEYIFMEKQECLVGSLYLNVYIKKKLITILYYKEAWTEFI